MDQGESRAREGVVSSEVIVPVKDGTIPAFRAMPAGRGRFPVVVSVSEIWGMRYHVREVCLDLAEAGYFAVAPELFTRQGDVYSFTEVVQLLQSVIAKKTDVEVQSDLDATLAWAATTQEADMSRLGANGYCYGGRQVYLYLARNPAIKAAVSWYGGPLAAPANPAHPQNPIDIAAAIGAPVLGIFGDRDHIIANESVARFRQLLTDAGKIFEFQIYPGLPHGFAGPGQHYHDKETKDGWHRMLGWFKKHGVA